jgi:diadenosine tetraphosphate (Ap4A) HIT family hydrolase
MSLQVSKCGVCGFTLWLPVARLVTADVGLYDDGRFPGRLLVSAHEHFEHLDAVPATEFSRFMADVQRACRALRYLSEVERVNVAILGNREPHVHAHLIPRRSGEPNALRAPWDGAEQRTPLGPALRVELIEQLSRLLSV